jgi:hypothetical protein
LVENEVLEVLADISTEEKKQMGYSLAEFMVDCTFQGKPCNKR